MKKHLLLCLLSLLVTSSFAQIVVTIGTGTGSNTNQSYPAPYGNYYWGAKHQFLYTAAELLAAGLGPGNLTTVAFNVTAVNGCPTLQGYTVLMKNSAVTSLTAWQTGLTTVLNPAPRTPVTGWNTYTLDVPFFWDGSSNLVVQVCFNNNSYVLNASTQWTSMPSGTFYTRYYRADAANVCPSTITSGTGIYRTDIQLTGQVMEACSGTPDPGNTLSTVYSVCPGLSFTLSLQNSIAGSGVTYQWQKSATGSDPWENVGTSNATYTTTQTASSFYRCQVTCAGNTGTSNPVEITMFTPAPGNTVSSTNPVCAGVNFTLSLQNATSGTVTYVWQTSPDGNDPWTNVGTSTATYVTNQTTATYYRCQVACGENTGISTPVLVTMNALINCYCTSMPSGTSDEEIVSVSVGSNTNVSDCITAAPGPGSILKRYSNFYPLGSLFDLPQLSTVPFIVTEDECEAGTYYAFGCGIWVDFNQDGDFADAGEQVFVESSILIGPRSISGGIAVPPDAMLGETMMRVTVAESYAGPSLTPCLMYGWGETEDYIVTITPPLPCAQPSNLAANGITSSGANLSWNAGGTETAWEYIYGVAPVPEPSGSGTGTSSNTANPLTGLSPNTSYQYYVRADCGDEYSDWTGPYTFKTLCEAFTTPFSENFDGVTAPMLPDCWYRKINSASGEAQVDTYTLFAPHSFPNQARLYNHTDPAATLLLITPQLTNALNTLQMRFWATSNALLQMMEIGTMTDPNDVSSYTMLMSISINNVYTEYIVSFQDYIGTDQYIAFKHGLGYTFRSIYIDDVDIYTPSSLSGLVYDYNGNPVADATITRIGGISTTSGPGGGYLLTPLPFGIQQFNCIKAGYNPETVSIDIPAGTAVIHDFTLTNPEMAVEPASIYDILPATMTVTHSLTLTNDGNGPLDWTASIQFPELGPSGGGAASPLTYCAASGGCDEGITNVTFGTINNSSACSNYADYTSISTDLILNENYSIIVTVNPYYTADQVGAWIDYDHNGVFDEGMITFTHPDNIYTGTFTVPETAQLGPTTIRIRLIYTGALDPCGTTQYGEVEDYTVNISAPWISLDIKNGTIVPFGGTQNIMLTLDASATPPSRAPGETYTAEVVFTSPTGIDPVTVPVTLVVTDAGLQGPEELTPYIVDEGNGVFMLKWKYFTLRDMVFDRFEIYSNGELVGTTPVSNFLLHLTEPSVYCYKVYAVYEGGVYSDPSNQVCITFPLPPGVPVAGWALAVGAMLIVGFTIFMVRRRM